MMDRLPLRRRLRRMDNAGEYKGYKLEGLDLHYKLKLSLSEALIGFKVKFEFLDEKPIMLSSSKITKPGTVKVIPELGFKKNMVTPFGQINKKGDLYVHFEVEFPDELTNKQQKHVVTAFGMPRIEKTEDKQDKQ